MNKLDSTQLEQLKAIGAYLYEVRLSQSRTLEEIAAKTYIPLRLLRALEAGQEQTLPEPVFVQGFIRRYGDALGLDGQELAQAFPVHRAAVPEIKTEYFDDSLADLGSTAASDTAVPTGFSMRRAQRRSPSLLTSAALALVILGGLVYLLSRLGSRPASVAEQPDVTAPESVAPAASPGSVSSPVSSPVAATPSASTPASPAAATSPSPSPSPAANAPVRVAVNLTGDSWLEVTVDGEVEVSETLPRGTKRSWSGQQAVTIVAGNAGAVQVAFNQSKAQTMGSVGAVAERTFTAKQD